MSTNHRKAGSRTREKTVRKKAPVKAKIKSSVSVQTKALLSIMILSSILAATSFALSIASAVSSGNSGLVFQHQNFDKKNDSFKEEVKKTDVSFSRGRFEEYTYNRSVSSTDLVLNASYGYITPYIDGRLENWELADAGYRNIQSINNTEFDVYSKTTFSDNGRQLYIGMKITNDNIEECIGHPSWCESYWVKLYFDEGNDGSFGSGSGDLILNNNQEDLKEINDSIGSVFGCRYFFGFSEGCPDVSCEPEIQNNCWECEENNIITPDIWTGDTCLYLSTTTPTSTPAIGGKMTSILDGLWDNRNYGVGWYAESHGNTGADDRINFSSYKRQHDGYLEVEFMIPLVGLDTYSPGLFDDESDINVAYNDILGIGIELLGLGAETDHECFSDTDCDQDNGYFCSWPLGDFCMENEHCQMWNPNTHCVDNLCSGVCWGGDTHIPTSFDRFNATTYAKLKILSKPSEQLPNVKSIFDDL